jgi:formate--tetrahydrofolate ligase
MAALLKEAIKPNLVQTLEQNPVILHGGPFANIAQGTNTIIATRMGLSLSDYVVTEAGFGFDLGGEKFLDIKCRAAALKPQAIVLVATVRALKYHGGASLKNLKEEDLEALKKGIVNLEKHLENAALFGVPTVVSINRFTQDTDAEINTIKEACDRLGVKAYASTVWADGGKGAEDVAREVVKLVESGEADFKPLYPLDAPVYEKINTIATRIYGADAVEYSPEARLALRRIKKLGLENLPVCIAKTQKSLSDNDKLLGRPEGFTLHIREIELAAGAEFIIPITGSIMRMPGLPVVPSAEGIDIDADGQISGLF